ncbi:MAG: tetratricopeptide repeat protein [Vampirovibrionia bacterium]
MRFRCFGCCIIAITITFVMVLAVNAEEYARWSKQSMPLGVYIQQTSSVPGFKSTYPVQVAKALREWKKDTAGLIDFTIVADKANADIIIDWLPKMRKEDYIDQSKEHNYIWGVTQLGNPTYIKLVTKHPLTNDQSLSDNVVYMVALHEIGHSLGLWWHTRSPEDIMYPDFIVPATTANGARKIINKNTGVLSTRDINNIKALYNNNKVVFLDKVSKGTNLMLASKNNSMVGAIETTGSAAASVSTKSTDVNVDLGKALAYLKENPESFEAYNNIGLVYLQGQKYQDAIKYFDHAIKLNSTSATAYFNRGLAYSRIHNKDMAIADYEKFIQLKPNDPNTPNAVKEVDRLKQL